MKSISPTLRAHAFLGDDFNMGTQRYSIWPLGIALALSLLGFWLPWLAPAPSGLQLNAFELSDWVMMTPDVAYRAYPVQRLSFVSIAACLTLGFGLALARSRAGVPWRAWLARPATWALGLGLIASFLTTLPYFPHALVGWREPEWQQQWLLAVAAFAASVAALALSVGWGRLALVALALGGAHLTFWSWWLTRPLAESVIGSAPTGLGWFLCLGGWAVMLMVAVFDLGRAAWVPRSERAL